MPETVSETHIRQKLDLKMLLEDAFEVVEKVSVDRGPAQFLDPSAHLGFDVFDEEHDQPIGDVVPWDKPAS